MLPDSKVVDAPPHKISIEQTVEMAKQFELLVLYTSTPGFHVDVKMAKMMKDVEPEAEGLLRRAARHRRARKSAAYRQGHRFRHSPRVRLPDRRLRQRQAARGAARCQLPQKRPRRQQSRKRPAIENLDALPWVTKVYKRDLDITRYNVPFLLNPFLSLYTSRGCPAMCTFCLWPQTHSGHRWRLRSTDDIANEVRYALEAIPADQGNLLRRRYFQLPQRAYHRALREA